MRTTIRLSGEILQAAKRRAAETNRSLTSLIEDAVRHELQRGVAPLRVAEPLPVYRGAGLQSGVDLAKGAALLDHMESSDP